MDWPNLTCFCMDTVCVHFLFFFVFGNDDTIPQSDIYIYTGIYLIKVSAQTCEFEIEMYIGGMYFFKTILTGLLTNQASLSRIYVICCQILLALVLPSLQDHPKILRGSKFQGNLYVRSGQNSHYLNVIREWSSTQQWGLYIHEEDFLLKVGWLSKI